MKTSTREQYTAIYSQMGHLSMLIADMRERDAATFHGNKEETIAYYERQIEALSDAMTAIVDADRLRAALKVFATNSPQPHIEDEEAGDAN